MIINNEDKKEKEVTIKITVSDTKKPEITLAKEKVEILKFRINEESVLNNLKIGFRYFHYTPNKQNPKKYSKKGDKYIVSPFALVWSGGNQYLYAYITETGKFRTFRVDRMYAVADPLLEARDGTELYQKKDIVRQEAKVFDMYSGEEYTVRLRVLNRLADAVIDKFIGNQDSRTRTDNRSNQCQ